MSDATAQHFARERAAAIARGEVEPEDMTSAELQAAIKAIPPEDAAEFLSQDFSTGIDGPAGVPDLSDDELKGYLDAQEARHTANRVAKLIAPFEDAYREDVQRYGADSPQVFSVRDRLVNALANAQTDAERAPYKEAIASLRKAAD